MGEPSDDEDPRTLPVDGREHDPEGDPMMERRRLLQVTACVSIGGIAGCLGDGGEESDGCSPPEDLDGSVPELYETAEAESGQERRPSQLLSKMEADYQREPNGDQRCSDCSYYVPDENGDCAGACVRVEGLIDPDGWCEYYRSEVGGSW